MENEADINSFAVSGSAEFRQHIQEVSRMGELGPRVNGLKTLSNSIQLQ